MEPCLMLPECQQVCGDLECYRGDDKLPFFNMVVPKNITAENSKNMCIYYNSKTSILTHFI